MKLTDCYYEKKDWRACKKEVSRGFCFGLEGPHAAAEKMPSSYWACVATTTFHSSSHVLTIGQMEVFRECWKSHNNDQRTATKDV